MRFDLKGGGSARGVRGAGSRGSPRSEHGGSDTVGPRLARVGLRSQSVQVRAGQRLLPRPRPRLRRPCGPRIPVRSLVNPSPTIGAYAGPDALVRAQSCQVLAHWCVRSLVRS